VKIVLDTNVLVSGLLSAHGPPGRIVDLLRSGTLQVVVDDRILGEYADVLRRPYFERYLTAMERENVIEFLRRNSVYVTATQIISDLPDADDQAFLEIAATEKVPLVTGNARHFPAPMRHGVNVLTPTEFCRSLRDRE
jgi:uncharacterized protein